MDQHGAKRMPQTVKVKLKGDQTNEGGGVVVCVCVLGGPVLGSSNFQVDWVARAGTRTGFCLWPTLWLEPELGSATFPALVLTARSASGVYAPLDSADGTGLTNLISINTP